MFFRKHHRLLTGASLLITGASLLGIIRHLAELHATSRIVAPISSPPPHKSAALAAARARLEGLGVRYVGDVPLVAWSLWFGELAGGRSSAMKAFEEWVDEQDVAHFLLTPDNLRDFILPEAPLSDLQEFSLTHMTPEKPAAMSSVHLSDSLRGYLLYYYGGYYFDIKWPKRTDGGGFAAMPFDIAEDLTLLGNSPDQWLLGMRELEKDTLGCNDIYCHHINECPPAWIPWIPSGPFSRRCSCCPQVLKSLRSMPEAFIACGSMASRPGNQLLEDWLHISRLRLDDGYPLAMKCPAKKHRDRERDECGYPFAWTDLWGSILHPLEYHYRGTSRILQKDGAFLNYFSRSHEGEYLVEKER